MNAAGQHLAYRLRRQSQFSGPAQLILGRDPFPVPGRADGVEVMGFHHAGKPLGEPGHGRAKLGVTVELKRRECHQGQLVLVGGLLVAQRLGPFEGPVPVRL